MIGAIVGDIVGSIYELHNVKTKEFPFFGERCSFTDDTVMTIAVADALMNGGKNDDFINSMKKYGRMYPRAGYGGRFRAWLRSNDRDPYNSWGNGSAMRVSPVGWIMDCGFCARTGMWPSNGRAIAKRSAAVTHNHPDGIKGAVATADAIFICRLFSEKWEDDYGNRLLPTMEECKRMVKEHTEQIYGYDLSRTLDEIRPTYHFDASCQRTVPEAIIAFLESTDYEDAIRNAISLGGDSDTLAAITGGIAEAAYGVPQWMQDRAWELLDEPLRNVCRRWRTYLESN